MKEVLAVANKEPCALRHVSRLGFVVVTQEVDVGGIKGNHPTGLLGRLASSV